MDIVRLVYHSRIAIDREAAQVAAEIANILTDSLANNWRDDITGALIYDAKWFVQVLEGSDRVVSRTFERILRDPRHVSVTLVSMQPIAARHFGNWWMASTRSTDDNAALFRHYGESGRFDPQVMSAERLVELTDALLQHTMQRHGLSPWMSRTTNAA